MAYYSLDDIIHGIEAKIEWYKVIIDKWESVTYLTKKDGKPFKNLSKNFSGASLRSKSPTSGRLELSVGGHTNLNGYIFDVINCYESLPYLKDEKKRAKTQNYQSKQDMTYQVYTYDLEDIKEAVADRIALRKEEFESLKRQRENAEKVYYNFRKAYDEAVKKLAEESEKDKNATLYCAVLDTIKSRYPYC